MLHQHMQEINEGQRHTYEVGELAVRGLSGDAPQLAQLGEVELLQAQRQLHCIQRLALPSQRLSVKIGGVLCLWQAGAASWLEATLEVSCRPAQSLTSISAQSLIAISAH